MADRRGRGRLRIHPVEGSHPRCEHSPNLPPPPATRDNLIAQAVHQLLIFLQQQAAMNRNALEPVIDTQDRVLERFLCFNPPTFLGEPDDTKAEYWLKRTEMNERWIRENRPRTSENFVREFRDQYISQVVREARKNLIFHLKQGTMTVAQYESKFNRLSKYASGLISAEEDKLFKFTQGLRPALQQSLMLVEIGSYAAAFRTVTRVEGGMNQFRPQQQQSRPTGSFK
ncbi:hypothetical protein DH2020_014310 [Rehmannia glutinosa]|uniref:Retrotransposon gag domain-containing protein n=1 Tax=Rehmannia glutinosa TaxID=99300 RepID=A0ABR0WZN1_REHGL